MFLSYPCSYGIVPDLSGYIVLTLDAKELSIDDANYGLILVDATWKLADEMFCKLDLGKKAIPRSLPSHFRTAYPRKQTLCKNPTTGLASIEALYLAYSIMGRNTSGLLDHYYWKDLFLQKNVESGSTSTEIEISFDSSKLNSTSSSCLFMK